MGRPNRQRRLLRAPRRQWAVQGLRNQLRAPGLPGTLVPAVAVVHVPLSRWRLLCRRFARLRSSRARPVHLQLANRFRRAADRRRPDAHALELRKACHHLHQFGRLQMQRMRQTAVRVYAWFERRLQLEGPVKDAVLHQVPRNTASWWYVFGSAAFTLLFLQIFTGILLALIYVPSAGEAWNSLNILNHQIPLGWFLRAMHGWGSNFMVAIVLIHMAQVFLFGAYKFPRELTWILGVFLLLMTLGMAFTGQVLRFDQDAYWGLGIGAS